jgi:hypothetical protein
MPILMHYISEGKKLDVIIIIKLKKINILKLINK